jgi:hypothetical protein
MNELDLDQITKPEVQVLPELDLDVITGGKPAPTEFQSQFMGAQPELDLDQIAPETPEDFFKIRQRNLLDSVSAAFGGEPKLGRTTYQAGKGLFFSDEDVSWETNDIEALRQDLVDLKTNNPELANTPEGRAYEEDINRRIGVVLDSDELDPIDTIKFIFNTAVDDPAELLDAVGEGWFEDPMLPVLYTASFFTGGRVSQALSRTHSLDNLISRLRNAESLKKRALGITLEDAKFATGAIAADAGLGYVYEIAQNKAIGRDPLHNAKAMAAMDAVFTSGALGLHTAFKLLRGRPGRYRSPEEFAEDWKKFIEENDGQLSKMPEVLDDLVNRMRELPRSTGDKATNQSIVDRIKSYLAPFKPGREKSSEAIKKPDKIVARVLKDYGDEPELGTVGISKISEKAGVAAPVWTTGKRTVHYNLQNILDDFRTGYGFLRGETQSGKLSTSRFARPRREAFKDFDFKEFNRWIRNKGGAKAYAEFLMRLESGKAKYTIPQIQLADTYRRAIFEALKQMDADPRQFGKWTTKKGFKGKVTLGLEAGYTYARKSASEVLQDPRLIYRPVKDVLMGMHQFAKDLTTKYDESGRSYYKMRQNLSNMLRDWEGGRMAGELSINDFANYIKGYLGSQEKLDAMSHYLEGNLDAYNAYRIKKNLPEVELTARDIEIAPTIRKYFNDMLDWTQRSELFSDFRRNYGLYNAARNYSENKAGVEFVKNKTAKELDKEMWEYLQKLEDPFDVAEQITPRQKRDTDQSRRLRQRDNYVPHVTRREFAPDDASIWQDTLMDAHRAGQLQTTSRFTKRRTHDTIVEALDAGETLLTEDISSLIRIYGKSMLRSQINSRLISQLSKMKSSATGKPLLGAKHQVPDWYVEFKHPNFRTGPRGEDYLYVNPNLAPDLRLYFDTNDPNIANRILQNIILISKRSALGLSLFHNMALGWSALVAGQSPIQVSKNFLPLGRAWRSKGHMAIAGEEGYEVLQLGMRNGLGLGILEELKGDTLINAMRRIGKFAEETTVGNRYLKPIGKMGNMSMRVTARAQEILDRYLWDQVNSGLKATHFITTFEKLVYQDAKAAAKEGRKLATRDLLAQRAAQFTNDAFGNQNWNQMAMNVENHMGHRIAAALNKPSMRGYIRMLVFAPDWTLSNIRVIWKAAPALLPKKMQRNLGLMDAATPEYLAYSIRSALLFAMVAEVLQQTSGQGSIFDDSLKDALRPDLGDGKQMEISKQLSEVLRLFIHGPAHVFTHKMSTPLKAMANTDSLGEFLMEFGKTSLPITAQQYIKNPEGASAMGIVGLPIYNKY